MNFKFIEEYKSAPASEKILLVGYPKSGNTWLALSLCRLLNLQFIDFHDPDNKIYHENYYKNPGNSLQTSYKYLVKSHAYHANPEDYDKMIYIVRDPRDVAVSMYYYKYAFLENRIQKLNSLQQRLLLKKTIKETCLNWKQHVNEWKSEAYNVKFEDMKKNTGKVLNDILVNLVKIPVDKELIDETIAYTNIDNLKKVHDDSDFKNFFRKGRSGDYRSHLDFLDYFFYIKRISREMKYFGYA